MDHRVSKDMISSGMSYTGQKSQEELGGSQYGSVARPDNLLEAYSSIYEAASSNPADVLKVEREKKEVKQTPKPMEENFTDVFDIIKDYLLGEGYADNEEAAFVIMRNMSEEWKNSIIEDVYTGPIKRQETKPKPEGGSILGPGRSGDFGKGYERRNKPNVPSPGRAEGGSGRIPDSVIKYGSGG